MIKIDERIKADICTAPDIISNGKKEAGLRYNEGKLRYDLENPYAREQLIKVFAMGAQKYAPRNWEKGMSWSSLIASMERHLAAYKSGEDYDRESGLLHTAHIQWNAHAGTAYYQLAPQFDDRQHAYLRATKIGLNIDGVLANFTGHVLKQIGKEGHEVLHWNDPTIVNAFENYKGIKEFWMDIPPLVSHSEFTFEPFCYITARSIDKEITQAWLDKNHFPIAPVYSIGIGESKVKVASQAGMEIFIDDNFTNFLELNKAGICTFLYDAPYNKKYDVGHKRVHSIKEIGERFK